MSLRRTDGRPARSQPGRLLAFVAVYLLAGGPAFALVVGLVGLDSEVTAGIREGAMGRDVRFVEATSGSPWKKGAPNVARLVFEERVDLLLCGRDRATAHVAAQIATKARIPLVTLCREPALTRIFDPWIIVASPRFLGDRRGRERGLWIMGSILVASEGTPSSAAGSPRRLADRLAAGLAGGSVETGAETRSDRPGPRDVGLADRSAATGAKKHSDRADRLSATVAKGSDAIETETLSDRLGRRDAVHFASGEGRP